MAENDFPAAPGDLAGAVAPPAEQPKLDAAVEVTVEQAVQLPADTEFSDDVKPPEGVKEDVVQQAYDDMDSEAEEDAYGEMFDEDGPITYADFGLMTEDELAFAFDLTKNTMAKWRKNEDVDGQSGPAFCRIGKTIYYRVDDVDTWIGSNIEHPPARYLSGPPTTPYPAPKAAPVTTAAP